MEKNPRYTLGSEERLKRRKFLEELFDSGESFSIYPLRVIFAFKKEEDVVKGRPDDGENNNTSLQFGVGVSKKHFKKAVDRNRIKRLIREAYRLQKNDLFKLVREKKEWSLRLFILYTGSELPTFALVEQKVSEALIRLQRKMGK